VAWFAPGAGCAYQRADFGFDRQLLQADALTDDGDYAAARALYLSIAPDSERQDLLSYIRYRLAYLTELEGDAAAALEQYEAIWTHPLGVYDERAAQAMYRSGRVRRELLGDESGALAMWSDLVRMYPNTTFALDGLTELVRHARSTGQIEAMRDWLRAVADELARSEVGDNVLYAWATLTDDDLGDCDLALEAYETIMTTYTRGGLWDDSLWRTSLCHRRQGRIDAEYALLLGFIDAREVSFVAADYDSEYYGDALDRMATIHEERQQWQQAIEMWERYLSIFPLTLRADDVTWHIMELSEETGDRERRCAGLERMRGEFFESRWLDDAEALVQRTGGCP
jgi:tetratricopeptide (TPR) repeat protein